MSLRARPAVLRSLAIKVSPEMQDADLKRRFIDEMQIMGQLQHPGIPPVHDLGELADGRPFFAKKLIMQRWRLLLRGQPSKISAAG